MGDNRKVTGTSAEDTLVGWWYIEGVFASCGD